MGVLSGPRINFWGGIQTNVCVANNDDKIGDEVMLDLATATVSSQFSDQEIIDQVRKPTGDYYTAGGWNYYGDHQVSTSNAVVGSEGRAGAVAATGHLVGEPVYLLGSIDPVSGQGPFMGAMMVDLDPTSSETTQIYLGGLQIGGRDGVKLLIRHDTVCHSHSLGFRIAKGISDAPGSNVGNGTFQACFPRSSVVAWDENSQALAAIMGDDAATGLVLRFSMFEMCPFMTTAEYRQALAAGENPSNPSSGRVIGTLGPKYDGEPDTCPPGRLLVNTSAGKPDSRPVGYARLQDDRLSIDAVSLFTKEDFRPDRKAYDNSAIGPNIDYGRISVLTGEDQDDIGLDFDANPTDYYKYGGIVDLALTAAQQKALASGAMTLTGNKNGNSVTISEEPLRIYGNARNIYIDDCDELTAVLSYIVSYLGGPLAEDTSFTITSSASEGLSSGKFLSYPGTVEAAAGQNVISFSVSGSENENFGVEKLSVSGGGGSTFTSFRKYLKTDFGIPAGSTITWDQVYEHVLRFYYVTFPAMSLRIPLNDQGSIVATAPQILARLSEGFHGTTLRMPITRSMSQSQTRLLEDFLNGSPWNPPCFQPSPATESS